MVSRRQIHVHLGELFSKTPPHSVESEMAVLGAMILNHDTIPEVQTVISAADFYVTAHTAIFASITAIFSEHGRLDLVLLVDDMRGLENLRDVGGVDYLEKLARETPGPAGAMSWAKTVREHAILRRVIQESAETIYDAYHTRDGADAAGVAAKGIERLTQAAKDLDSGRSMSIGDAARSLLADIDAGRRQMIGSGFDWLDQITGGIPKKGVVTLIGHPSHGKSTFGLTLMANLASLHGGGGTVHSVEQGPQRVAGTLLSVQTGMPVHQWVNRGYQPNSIERQAYEQANARLDEISLVVEPDSMDAAEIYRRAVAGATRGLARVMVDYIQDLKPMQDMTNDAEGLAESMRVLARIATELDMLVIVVSQLDKAARTADRAPRLNDSRGSAAIADRTDLGISVYRPNFNERPEDQYDPDAFERERSKTEFAILKNKYGPLGQAVRQFDGTSMRFV